MSTRGPWYITMRAVEEYCALTGRNPEDDEAFGDAEEELIDIAVTARHVRDQDNGLVMYRAVRSESCAARYRLLVSPTPSREGNKPQLVSVLPESDRGGGGGPVLARQRLSLELPGHTVRKIDDIASAKKETRERVVELAVEHAWKHRPK